MVEQATVVIPTYNESVNLPKIAAALFALPVPGLRLLVVDDNSPDGTGQLAEELSDSYQGRISVLHRPGKMGLGRAYLDGFRRALEDGADAVAQMDADFSHPVEKLPDLLNAVNNYDVAIGSRYVHGGSVDQNWSAFRKFLSAFGNTYARAILRIPIHDITGGFRAWRRETLLDMPLDRVRSSGYAFQVEMIYIAYRLGCSIKEVPIYFADRVEGESKMSLKIQLEAAVRTWQMLYDYRDITKRRK